MTDHDLVKAVRSGNHGAFKMLISSYQHLVTHMVARVIDDDHDREELCQDVFMRIYEKIGSFNFDSKLSTWIATIAYRMAVDFLKKKNRRIQETDLDQVDFQIGEEDLTMEKEDFARFIHKLIAQMPYQYRTVLTLYHLDGFNYPEIVEVTGLPEGTVKNYLFRARKKLKALAEPYIGSEIHEL